MNDVKACPLCRRYEPDHEPGCLENLAALDVRLAVILDGPAIATDLKIHPGTIRNWASAGRLVRRGYDIYGRGLYDYDDVKQLAIDAGIYTEEEPLECTEH